jgi:hypothetical protein
MRTVVIMLTTTALFLGFEARAQESRPEISMQGHRFFHPGQRRSGHDQAHDKHRCLSGEVSISTSERHHTIELTASHFPG